jgi:hypothetical protein
MDGEADHLAAPRLLIAPPGARCGRTSSTKERAHEEERAETLLNWLNDSGVARYC